MPLPLGSCGPRRITVQKGRVYCIDMRCEGWRKGRVGCETVGVVVTCTVWCVWCSGWDWCMVKQHRKVPGQWQGRGGFFSALSASR
jgi:hypothetical protein